MQPSNNNKGFLSSQSNLPPVPKHLLSSSPPTTVLSSSTTMNPTTAINCNNLENWTKQIYEEVSHALQMEEKNQLEIALSLYGKCLSSIGFCLSSCSSSSLSTTTTVNNNISSIDRLLLLFDKCTERTKCLLQKVKQVQQSLQQNSSLQNSTTINNRPISPTNRVNIFGNQSTSKMGTSQFHQATTTTHSQQQHSNNQSPTNVLSSSSTSALPLLSNPTTATTTTTGATANQLQQSNLQYQQQVTNEKINSLKSRIQKVELERNELVKRMNEQKGDIYLKLCRKYQEKNRLKEMLEKELQNEIAHLNISSFFNRPYKESLQEINTAINSNMNTNSGNNNLNNSSNLSKNKVKYEYDNFYINFIKSNFITMDKETFEYEKQWLNQLPNIDLKEDVYYFILGYILNLENHPFLYIFDKFIEKLKIDYLNNNNNLNNNNIVNEIKKFCQTLTSFLLNNQWYNLNSLNDKIDNLNISFILCSVFIQTIVTKIYSNLINFYHKNNLENKEMENQLNKLSLISLTDLGVKNNNLFLEREYQQCIVKLNELNNFNLLIFEQLNLFKNIYEMLISIIKKKIDINNNDIDEQLIIIFSYIIIKSNVKLIYSIFNLMMECIVDTSGNFLLDLNANEWNTISMFKSAFLFILSFNNDHDHNSNNKQSFRKKKDEEEQLFEKQLDKHIKEEELINLTVDNNDNGMNNNSNHSLYSKGGEEEHDWKGRSFDRLQKELESFGEYVTSEVNNLKEEEEENLGQYVSRDITNNNSFYNNDDIISTSTTSEYNNFMNENNDNNNGNNSFHTNSFVVDDNYFDRSNSDYFGSNHNSRNKVKKDIDFDTLLERELSGNSFSKDDNEGGNESYTSFGSNNNQQQEEVGKSQHLMARFNKLMKK
ncbi:hypothetical protein ABK040_016223 [Willaertia magna]